MPQELGTRPADPFAALGELPARVNIARALPQMAERASDRIAVLAAPRGRAARASDWGEIRYGELEARSNAIAAGLAERGVGPGSRVCLFVRPGIELIALTYAVFKTGAVVVLADPGMGRKRLLAAMAHVKPSVFIGIPLAHMARSLFPASFASVELSITVGTKLLWSGETLAGVTRAGADFACADTAADDPAAILFTSGSTGPPKGVVYSHGMFDAQVRALRSLYDFRPGEVDLACFPLFALFNTALSMTSVFPRLDPSRPGSCDPADIVHAIGRGGATTTFGSPAIWRRVVPWCLERNVRLDSLQRVLIAGAPVPAALIADFQRLLGKAADVHTPYGATESLPVASISGREVVPGLVQRIQEGAGTCVGRPAPGIDLRLIRITDDAISTWDDGLCVAAGELGEVCVRGPVVTHSYDGEPEQTARAKIVQPAANGAPDAHRGLWHRMGDIGYLDDQGRLWFCGRKAHRLETAAGLRMPVPTENVFNVHPRVHRTALVGHGIAGAEEPVLVVEPERGHFPRRRAERDSFVAELRRIGSRSPVASDVERFLFQRAFPVDVRHNAKIHREQLRAWAAKELR